MNVGEKYNMLECIKYTTSDKRGKKFLFRCDCGNKIEYTGTYVKNNRYKSCGCRKYNKNKDEDILRTKFNRLRPIKRVDNINRGKAFLCKCDCGNTSIVSLGSLKNGRIKSCGCLNSEVQSEFMKKYNNKHGKSNTPEYKVWKGMKERCSNVNSKSYKNYGGRGIKVCERWKNSFDNFISDMGERPTKKHQIDRIDNDKNYSPENCKWVTRSENTLNKRHGIGKSGFRNIILDGKSYYAMVKRQGKIRTSHYTNLETALSRRDLYINEYNKNPQKWIEDTIKKNYLK
ncbi:hypothetical protein NLV77_000775 [Staphylococcus ureilyticus]|uniref:hypothetical protein n=1 Tax=Staphylococcus ureilyticus TaxID=94138 RepID=UPI0021570ECE|nr:hypothetical protein [Staphylococcus ureilyticus]MDV3051840.1 hypothetical protein [Staphylococcus ureilyticus]